MSWKQSSSSRKKSCDVGQEARELLAVVLLEEGDVLIEDVVDELLLLGGAALALAAVRQVVQPLCGPNGLNAWYGYTTHFNKFLP